MANVQCGQQVHGQFDGPHQLHEYRVAAEPGQVLDLQVLPVGEYLSVWVIVAEPSGGIIADSQYQKKVRFQTDKLSAKGLYTIKIYNTELGPRIESPNLYLANSRAATRNGEYDLSIACINSDGSWVAQGGGGTQGTAQSSSPPATSGPNSATGAQGGAPNKYVQKAQEVQDTISGVAGAVQAFRDLFGAFRPRSKGAAETGKASPGASQAPGYQKPEDVIPKGRQPVYAEPVKAPTIQVPQEPEKSTEGQPASSRPCQGNFSESGEWSYGKSFKSYVEITGTTLDKAFLAIAHAIAAEGFLGVDGKKDLGIISAYQEDNGKKSTINAVLTEPALGAVRAEVVFHLGRDLRAPSAAMRDSLCKVLESAVPAEQRGAQSQVSSGIRLRTAAGDKSLESTVGQFRTAGAGPVLLFYFDFSGARAGVRTNERKPSLLVHATSDPAKSYALVRCSSDNDDDRRSVKVGSAHQLLKMSATGKGDLAPDKDWTLPFSAEKEAEGIWRVTPSQEFGPGEYGLWDIQGYGVALFGVD